VIVKRLQSGARIVLKCQRPAPNPNPSPHRRAARAS
jgi:hypothetical protein